MRSDTGGIRVGNGDRASAVVLILVGLYVAYEAWPLSFGGPRHPGAGFFPLVLAVLLVAAAARILIASLGRDAAPSEVGFGRAAIGVLAAAAAVIAYALTVEDAGFVAATAAVMLVMLGPIGRVGWRLTLAVTVVGTIGSYVLFSRLGVPLPAGVLAF